MSLVSTPFNLTSIFFPSPTTGFILSLYFQPPTILTSFLHNLSTPFPNFHQPPPILSSSFHTSSTHYPAVFIDPHHLYPCTPFPLPPFTHLLILIHQHQSPLLSLRYTPSLLPLLNLDASPLLSLPLTLPYSISNHRFFLPFSSSSYSFPYVVPLTAAFLPPFLFSSASFSLPQHLPLFQLSPHSWHNLLAHCILISSLFSLLQSLHTPFILLLLFFFLHLLSLPVLFSSPCCMTSPQYYH